MTRQSQRHALPIFVAPTPPPDPLVVAGKARQAALIRAVLASLSQMGARISVGLSAGYDAQPGPPMWKNQEALTIHLRYVPVFAPDLTHIWGAQCIWGPQRDKQYDGTQELACVAAAEKLAALGYTTTYIPPSPGHAWFMPQVMISAGSVDLTPYMEDART